MSAGDRPGDAIADPTPAPDGSRSGAAPPARPSAAAFVRGLGPDLRVVLPSWLAARALVVFAYVLATAVVHHHLPNGTTMHLELGPIAWDGSFYRDIAFDGYPREEALRFFPLYPGMGRAVAVLLLGQVDVALVLVANAASLAAAVVLRRLVLFEKGDAALAERSVWVLALFPSAFVLTWAYAEGLFLLLTIACLFAARRGWYAVAAVLGLLAALTRPLGVIMALPVAIEALRTWRGADGRGRAARVVAVGAPVAGLVSYLAWVGVRYGDPTVPFTWQSTYRAETIDPIRRLIMGFGDLLGPERFGDGLHVPFMLAFAGLLFVVGRRWPASYTALAGCILLTAVSSENLNSLERYGLNAFPLVLAVAGITNTKRRERLALAVCGNGLLALTALAWLTVYVP